MQNENLMLEERLAHMFMRKHVILVGRATTAIYLALKTASQRPKKVILPDVLCPSPANACLYAGLVSSFCDVSLRDYNICPDSMQGMMLENVAAVVPVHLFGQPADMETICKLAKAHNVSVIEDVAQAFGGMLKGRPMGSFGDVSVLSFGKILGNGDGGAVMTDSDSLAEKIRDELRNIPAKPPNLSERYEEYKRYYYSTSSLKDIGEKRIRFHRMPALFKDLYLYRYTDDNTERINAALDGLPENLAARKRNAMLYRRLLNHPDIIHPEYDWDQGTIYRYSIRIPGKCKEVTEELRKRKFDASNLYYVPLHDIYESPLDSEKTHPNTMAISSSILNLWVEPRITEDYVRGVCGTILDMLSP